MKLRLHDIGLGLVFFLGPALAVTGCRSFTQPAPARFASVTIQGQTAQRIQNTAVEVFSAEGYQSALSGQGMTFQKQGTFANTLAHEGLLAAHGGAVTLVRVRAEVVDLGGGAHRLQCEAFMVRGAGDRFFEEEVRVAQRHRRPFQNLLDQVARKLN